MKNKIFKLFLGFVALLQMPCFAADTTDAKFYQDTFGWTKLHRTVALYKFDKDRFWEDQEDQENVYAEEFKKSLPVSLPREIFNVPDKAGRTPLHLAIMCGNQAAIKVLKDTGKVDENARDFFGLTPADYAKEAQEIPDSKDKNYKELLTLFAPFVFSSEALADRFFNDGKEIVNSFKNKNSEEKAAAIYNFVEDKLKTKEINFTQQGLTPENVYSFLSAPELLKTDREQIIPLLNQAKPFTSYNKTAEVAHALALIQIDTEYQRVFDAFKHLKENEYELKQHLKLQEARMRMEARMRLHGSHGSYNNVIDPEIHNTYNYIQTKYKHVLNALVWLHDLYDDVIDPKKHAAYYYIPWYFRPLENVLDQYNSIVHIGSRKEIDHFVNRNLAFFFPLELKRIVFREAYFNTKSIDRSHDYAEKAGFKDLLLSDACQYCDLDDVKKCVETYKCPINQEYRLEIRNPPYVYMTSPLHEASKRGKADIVEYLISKGARTNIFDATIKMPYDVINEQNEDNHPANTKKLKTLLKPSYWSRVSHFLRCYSSRDFAIQPLLFEVEILNFCSRYGSIALIGACIKKLVGTSNIKSFVLASGLWLSTEALLSFFTTLLTYKLGPIDKSWHDFFVKLPAFETPSTIVYYALLGGRIGTVGTLATCAASLPTKYAAILWPITAFEALKLWYMTPCVDWSYQDWKQKLFGSKLRTALTLGAGTLVTAAATALLAKRYPAVLSTLQSTGKFVSSALPKLWGNRRCRLHGFDTIRSC